MTIFLGILGLIGFVFMSRKIADLTARLRQVEDILLRQAESEIAREGRPIPTAPPGPEVEVAPEAPPEASQEGPWAGPKAEAAPAPLPKAAPVAQPAPPAEPGGLAPLFTRLATWLSENWFLAAAAASLGLAGIFLVQYGAERNVFPPAVRIWMALAFAAALIVAGEWVRRRHGDAVEDGATLTRGIPSVLSGAGLVTAYGAVLGAMHLYDLIGPGVGLVAVIAISLLSVLLGWFHGPVLVATGLLGGGLAPLVVGGSTEDLSPMHAYYGALALLGVAVDAVRRWAGRWVSWLALGIGLGGASLAYLGDADSAPAYALVLLALTVLALVFPGGHVVPRHPGRMVAEALAAPGRRRPAQATWMAFASVAVASAGAFWIADEILLLGAGLAAALFALMAVYGRAARALQDAALPPVVALLAMAPLARVPILPVAVDPADPLPPLPPGAGAMLVLMALAAGVALVAFRRSTMGAPTWRAPWALGAVLVLPAMGLLLHVLARAPELIGPYPWALIAMGAAAALTGMAAIWTRMGDAGGRRDAALAGLMALALIGYGLGWLVGDTALTVAVAGLAFGGALLARRLDLPAMGWFVVLAAPFVTWRLMIDPGVFWHAVTGALWEASISMAGSAALFWLARGPLRGLPGRARTAFDVAETTAFGLAGYTLSVWLARAVEALDLDAFHGTLGILASIWLILAFVQLELMSRRAGLRSVRIAIASVFGLFGTLILAVGVIVLSPLNEWFEDVAGPPILNSMLPAYLLPALLLWGMGRRLGWRFATWPGIALAGYWAGLALRHTIRGSGEMALRYGISSTEMVVYTVALIVLGAVLFWQGLARGAPSLRRAGAVVIGLTVAKVFLLDAAALGGLYRVGAFLALGLALIGLTWLDRWASARTRVA